MDGIWYGVSVTPMQTLAFYNAVANNGNGKTTICVRNKRVEQNHCENGKEVINPQICSTDTLKLKAVLKM
jgi:cell division protein FtsI (penicillin-binding protein 3)